MRTRISLPEALVREVDAAVGARRRSRFVEEAIRAQLQRNRRLSAFGQVAGSLKDVDTPGWETPEATSSWVAQQRAADDARLVDADVDLAAARARARPRG